MLVVSELLLVLVPLLLLLEARKGSRVLLHSNGPACQLLPAWSACNHQRSIHNSGAIPAQTKSPHGNKKGIPCARQSKRTMVQAASSGQIRWAVTLRCCCARSLRSLSLPCRLPAPLAAPLAHCPGAAGGAARLPPPPSMPISLCSCRVMVGATNRARPCA